MGTWTALGLLLVVVWSNRAAEVKQSLQYGQIGKGRNIRQAEPTDSGSSADTPLGECKIKNVGKHPWIIRITRDSEELGPKGQTMMHGALVSTRSVLSSTAWKEDLASYLSVFGNFKSSVWMFGYNYQDNCRQGRHAKTAVWHPRSAKYEEQPLGTLGDFGLFEPWEPFEVEGEPFLMQPKQSHHIELIALIIRGLIEKPESLLMYLFKVDVVTEDDKGELLQEEGVKFTFIGFPTCKDMRNYQKQKNRQYDQDVTNTSFFCGTGIPNTWNRSSSREGGDDFEGRTGEDGLGGAVVFIENTANDIFLPLGLYDYAMGKTIEPHFFAAFQKVFFDWFDTTAVPNPKTSTVNTGTTIERFNLPRTQSTGVSGGPSTKKTSDSFPVISPVPPDTSQKVEVTEGLNKLKETTPRSEDGSESLLGVFWTVAVLVFAAIV